MNYKYDIQVSSRFKRDMKTAAKRGYNFDLLREVVELLASGRALDEKYRDHQLTGDYVGMRECHITPDWLLIYRIIDDTLVLLLSRTGTHSDLF